MSRLKSAKAILAAAEKWKQQCLLNGGSLFTEESLWTRENFGQLRTIFDEDTDWPRNAPQFYDTLEHRLDPLPPVAKQLCAEMIWIFYLIVLNPNREKKIEHIKRVWEWSEVELPDATETLSAILKQGIVNTPQPYIQYRGLEFRFIITTMFNWFSLEDRKSLLTVPWRFADWLDNRDHRKNRHFRHAFLFLLFPDSFEPILPEENKKAIVLFYAKKWNEDLLTNDEDSVAIDIALLKIRERLEAEHPDEEVNFYISPFNKWRPTTEDDQHSQDNETLSVPEVKETASFYSIDNILAEGCFLEREKLETILQRLSDKKNLILQGPPGTGKTWLAKKLAFAAIGKRDEDKIRPVQFHPNLSYEDFVRGWRPSGDGKLDLVDGPFLQMINTAKDDPESEYAIIIEEINRGNPAQIFGEILTLLESDKRNEAEALELSYRKREGERVYIPENLYVIGTMNVADRSIAMVDFALRRRFAFVDLEPVFGSVWRDWVHDQCKIGEEILSQVEERMNALNKQIAEDSNLGAQFRVGHSYVTPSAGEIDNSREWFTQVVETEIGPLLDEYWFDAPDIAQKAREQLLEGF